MFRKAFCLGLIGLLLSSTTVLADARDRQSAPRAQGSSTTKRVVWTLVGIGAGFGAGVLIGLHAFDDAINSDRKVWTSALVGAAAGGLSVGLLSRNVGRVPAVGASASRLRLEVPVPASISLRPSQRSDDDVLRRRVREVNGQLPASGSQVPGRSGKREAGS